MCPAEVSTNTHLIGSDVSISLADDVMLLSINTGEFVCYFQHSIFSDISNIYIFRELGEKIMFTNIG